MRKEDVDLVEFLQQSGYSHITNVVSEILTTVQFQRLKYISYLGSFPFVFGGAEYTRWEHGINTAKLATMILSANHIPEIDAEKIILWGLLHDIGHIFFSHIGETALCNRMFDHRQRSKEMLEDEELEILLRKGGIHLTEFPANGLFLMQSHVDCDSLDGISQTAKILGLASIPWEPLLAEVVHFKWGEWSWDAAALPTIREFWRLKGQIYREYVYSPKNQACEAWLEEIIRQLDPDSKDLELGDKVLLAKARNDPRVAPMLDQLQAGLQYQEVILETISARFGNDEGINCWQSILKKRLENTFHWDPLEFRVKVTLKTTFSLGEPEGFTRNSIPWKDLESLLNDFWTEDFWIFLDISWAWHELSGC